MHPRRKRENMGPVFSLICPLQLAGYLFMGFCLRARQEQDNTELTHYHLVVTYLTQQSTTHLASRFYMEMISNHFMFYNKFSRANIFYDQPSIDDPTTQFSSTTYHQMTIYGPDRWNKNVIKWYCCPMQLEAKGLVVKHLSNLLFFCYLEMAYFRHLGD
jgi:hypothetical protein